MVCYHLDFLNLVNLILFYFFDQAYGWFVYSVPQNITYPSRYWVYHVGGLNGYMTQLQLFPDRDVVAVVFINRGGTLYLQELILNMVQVFLDLV